MSYDLTISKKRNYLHAKVTGKNSEENVKGYLEELAQKCKETKCRRLLIEERLEGPRLGSLSVFDIASEGSAKSRGIFGAIAYVDLRAENTSMQNAEHVAVNRGMPVKVFPTVAGAEKWLMEQG